MQFSYVLRKPVEHGLGATLDRQVSDPANDRILDPLHLILPSAGPTASARRPARNRRPRRTESSRWRSHSTEPIARDCLRASRTGPQSHESCDARSSRRAAVWSRTVTAQGLIAAPVPANAGTIRANLQAPAAPETLHFRGDTNHVISSSAVHSHPPRGCRDRRTTRGHSDSSFRSRRLHPGVGHYAQRNSPKPTIVLVHGAWDNSSGWDTVVTELQQDGYPVIAPADPLRDLASDSAYISSVLDTITGPIILVGHSYGARSSPTPRSATPTSKRSSTSPVGRSDKGTQSPNSSPSTPAA